MASVLYEKPKLSRTNCYFHDLFCMLPDQTDALWNLYPGSANIKRPASVEKPTILQKTLKGKPASYKKTQINPSYLA